MSQQEQETSTKAIQAENTVNKATVTKNKTSGTSKQKPKPTEAVRGICKSGRPWKTPKKKFTTIKKTVNRLTFEKKTELRNELRHIKERSREIKEQRKEAAVQKHQRRAENAERRLANERKAEIVQVIRNPAKLKRMKKKQMRMIQKRDTSQLKVV